MLHPSTLFAVPCTAPNCTSDTYTIHHYTNYNIQGVPSPAEEVARDVLNRLVFLFEINTSITYQSEVTKISDATTKASLFKNKRMVTIMERQEEEEDAVSQ